MEDLSQHKQRSHQEPSLQSPLNIYTRKPQGLVSEPDLPPPHHEHKKGHARKPELAWKAAVFNFWLGGESSMASLSASRAMCSALSMKLCSRTIGSGTVGDSWESRELPKLTVGATKAKLAEVGTSSS